MVDECAVSSLVAAEGNEHVLCRFAGLGTAMSRAGNFKGVLETFPEIKTLLSFCEAAIAAASWRLGDDLLETLQDNILTDIKQLKHDVDVSSTSADREESLREELNALIDFGAAKTEIAAKKVELTRALLKKDPPDYVEVIRLSEEALDKFQRTLGPSHKLTRSFETVIEQGKTNFEDICKI